MKYAVPILSAQTVIFTDGKLRLVGYCLYFKFYSLIRGTALWLRDLYVEENWRQQKVGRALFTNVARVSFWFHSLQFLWISVNLFKSLIKFPRGWLVSIFFRSSGGASILFYFLPYVHWGPNFSRTALCYQSFSGQIQFRAEIIRRNREGNLKQICMVIIDTQK